jgi:hypothetical protein
MADSSFSVIVLQILLRQGVFVHPNKNRTEIAVPGNNLGYPEGEDTGEIIWDGLRKNEDRKIRG